MIEPVSARGCPSIQPKSLNEQVNIITGRMPRISSDLSAISIDTGQSEAPGGSNAAARAQDRHGARHGFAPGRSNGPVRMRLFGKLAPAKLALKQPPRAGVIMNVNRVSHTGTMVVGMPLTL
jgi:hypothetical protein